MDCAFVVYSPEAKKQCLGVCETTLRTFGLTSEAVAREMVQGALKNSERANMAIANTGVADDNDKAVPSGTQCFAWAFRFPGFNSPVILFSETRRFSGDRAQIREASAFYALQAVPRYFTRMQSHELHKQGISSTG